MAKSAGTAHGGQETLSGSRKRKAGNGRRRSARVQAATQGARSGADEAALADGAEQLPAGKEAANGGDQAGNGLVQETPNVDAAARQVFERTERIAGKIKDTKSHILEGTPAPETPARRKYLNERKQLRKEFQDRHDGEAGTAGLERIIGANEILLLGFLPAGLHAARAVGRIRGFAGDGTGFLVSPTMLMTNNHVLPNKEIAGAACIEFEAFDLFGEHHATTSCDFDPDRLFFTDRHLDVTLVALDEGEHAKTEDLGWHPMVGQEGKIQVGDPVNIIQHPGSRIKSIVLHNSHLMYLENDSDIEEFCWYSSDTERGSSGSPVFNNLWEVIGVHHRSIPKRDDGNRILDRDGNPMTDEDYERNPDRAQHWTNEGTRTSRIVRKIEEWSPAANSMTVARDDLLREWRRSQIKNHGQIAAREGALKSLRAAAGHLGNAAVPGAESFSSTRLDASGINLHFHFHGR